MLVCSISVQLADCRCFSNFECFHSLVISAQCCLYFLSVHHDVMSYIFFSESLN